MTQKSKRLILRFGKTRIPLEQPYAPLLMEKRLLVLNAAVVVVFASALLSLLFTPPVFVPSNPGCS